MLNHYQYHQITTSPYSTRSTQLNTPHVIGLQLVQCGRMAYPSSANIVMVYTVYGSSYLISIRSVSKHYNKGTI